MKTIKVFLTGLKHSGKTTFLRQLLPSPVEIEPHFAYFKQANTLFQIFDIRDDTAKSPPDYTFILFNLHEEGALPALLKIAAVSPNPVLVGNFWLEKKREIREFELLTTPYTYWEIDVSRGAQVKQLFLYLEDSSVELFTKQREFELDNEVEMENELNKAYYTLQKQIDAAKSDLLGYVKQEPILLRETEKLNRLAGIEWANERKCDVDQLHSWLSLLDAHFSSKTTELEERASRIIRQQEADIAILERDYNEILDLAREVEK